MTVNKLERFAQVANFDNVLEYTDYQSDGTEKPAGQWAEIFGASAPLIVELGCGTGVYTVELARQNPDQHYVGVDIKGGRLWKGAKKARAQGLENVRFLRIFIDHIEEYFAAGEVQQLWITFPDPYSNAGDRNKRLTAPKFLRQYKQILSAKGELHLKTDDPHFFDYSRRRLQEAGAREQAVLPDVYEAQSAAAAVQNIQTAFEEKHLANGRQIAYGRFSFT